ncbi:MAG: MMPL family transporter [Lachnospiraceae bacterium]|nr:MMPL family transporter [Lachnospiraceae bacterium]
MRKLAEAIVKNRYIILIAVFAMTIFSAVMIPKVNVIKDMSEYLPDDSSMRKGINIMESEFPDMETGNTVRVMFQGLPQEEKVTLKANLEKIPYVDSVDYESGSEDYNKDSYSLYVLHTSYDADSKEMADIESVVTDSYTDYYDMVYSVDTDESTEIPVWIICLALGLLMCILFVMCGSWIEPFLFLATILLAIVINMGTNAFLKGVSDTTNSIAAILQLVLSMDYSIILMNRYRQEAENTKNPTEAMEKALAAAFSAITSSSLTTIVGLLALVFMKFKIGADLGVVLAKGVLISMLCIFTVLPGLILIFDKWIQKTAKKTLHISMGRLGTFSYKFRYAVLGAFVIFFVGTVLLKGNTNVSYTFSEENEIDSVFPANNSIVLLYANSDEPSANELAGYLEKDENVVSVMSYGSTIGKGYSAEDLANVMEDMGSDISIDKSMMDLIFYEYHEGTSEGHMTLAEFVSFLQNDIMQNEMFYELIDAESRAQIDSFALFADKDELSKKRSSAELGQMFGIDPAMLEQVYAMAGTLSMSIQELLQFISSNQMLAEAMASGESAAQMQTVQMVIASVMEEKEYSAPEMAELFGSLSEGFEERQMELLYTFYYSIHNADDTWTMTPLEILEFLSEDMAQNKKYADFFDEDMKEMLDSAYTKIKDGEKQLRGENYSLMLVSTNLSEESEETNDFLADMSEKCRDNFSGEFYMIGASPMQYEMSLTFQDEMNTITLLTAVAIFIVVAITFRSLVIPLILVLLIQAGVYATVAIIGIQGYSIYFLALLIVQCILMGATIDYAILYTNYYREKRKTLEIKEALIEAYNGSIHTILTSGLIIILLVGLVGYAFSNPTIGQICQTISKGALCATILIIFILPGILAVFDRLVSGKKRG